MLIRRLIMLFNSELGVADFLDIYIKPVPGSGEIGVGYRPK